MRFFEEVWQKRKPQERTRDENARHLQRFAMDAFTLCRIMRTNKSAEPGWRKNYIVYVGNHHAKNLSYMLKQRGFQRHDPILAGAVTS